VAALADVAGPQIEPAGVFVFIGLSPNSGWLPSEIVRDQYGFVVTDLTLALELSRRVKVLPCAPPTLVAVIVATTFSTRSVC